MIQFQPWSLFRYRISLKCSCNMMSSEELVLNIFFCSAALLSAMYVSDECVKGPQSPISPPIHSPAESFCFRLAASSNEVGAFRERRPHFPSRISAKHRIRFQFLNLLFPKDG